VAANRLKRPKNVVSSPKYRPKNVASGLKYRWKNVVFCFKNRLKSVTCAENQKTMQRLIFKDLLAWKHSPTRKPLILLGARQVGKTWTMREFARREYESVAYINCDNEPLAKELFAADYNIDRILLSLQAITGVRIVPGKTLVILDELQEVERGLHSLKYFQENAPDIHVMAAGSLLGITLRRGESFPVGKVDMLHLHPMNFEEFLEANNQSQLVALLHEGDWAMVCLLRTKFVEMLRCYYYVGGMPEVVVSFVARGDLKEVRTKQQAIMDAYRRDISKHASVQESVRIGQVLDALPAQLAKENKKFIYNMLRAGARAADFELAIQWLVDAGIVCRVNRVRELGMPLKFYEDFGIFKLFLLDCGLLGCLTDTPASQVLVGDNVFQEFKGAFTEQFVLQQLVALGLNPYYWSNDKTTAEVDFVVQTEHRVVPVEVKAEGNVKSRSLANYIAAHPELKGLRISMLDYIDQGWMENIPLYGIDKYFKQLI
jgi:hypothetical protein